MGWLDQSDGSLERRIGGTSKNPAQRTIMVASVMALSDVANDRYPLARRLMQRDRRRRHRNGSLHRLIEVEARKDAERRAAVQEAAARSLRQAAIDKAIAINELIVVGEPSASPRAVDWDASVLGLEEKQ